MIDCEFHSTIIRRVKNVFTVSEIDYFGYPLPNDWLVCITVQFSNCSRRKKLYFIFILYLYFWLYFYSLQFGKCNTCELFYYNAISCFFRSRQISIIIAKDKLSINIYACYLSVWSKCKTVYTYHQWFHSAFWPT